MVSVATRLAAMKLYFVALLFFTAAGKRCQDEIDGCDFYLEDCEFMASLCPKTCKSCTEGQSESEAMTTYSSLDTEGNEFFDEMQLGVYVGDEYGESIDGHAPVTEASDHAFVLESTELTPSRRTSDSSLILAENLRDHVVDYAPLPHPSETENITVENSSYDNVDYELMLRSVELTSLPENDVVEAKNKISQSNVLELNKLLDKSKKREEKVLKKRTFDVGDMKIISNLVRQLKSEEKDPDELARKMDSIQKVITFYKNRNDPQFVEEVLNLFTRGISNESLASTSADEVMDALVTYQGWT